MSMENCEIRSFGGDAAPRISDERTIEGYGVVFGQESRVMFDFQKKDFCGSHRAGFCFSR